LFSSFNSYKTRRCWSSSLSYSIYIVIK